MFLTRKQELLLNRTERTLFWKRDESRCKKSKCVQELMVEYKSWNSNYVYRKSALWVERAPHIMLL